MERENVLIPQADLDRQREFEEKIRGLFAAREAHPAACVDTFGCQQNVADGQKLMGMLEASGFTLTQDPKEADLVLLNTCAIREHAEDRVFGNLGALTHTKKENPEQVICLCGCMAQEPRVSERIKKSYPHVDLVFGPQALWKFPELLWQVYETKKRVFSVQDEHGTIAEGIPVVREKGVKAWVSIMYGCNNFCSYCIVPYTRGRERSREPRSILNELADMQAKGFKEVVLLGQNVNSYHYVGEDGAVVGFADLLRIVAEAAPEMRVRFTTSHPKDMTDEIIDVIATVPNVCKHIHLPVQSGSNKVLKAMNRKYTREWYLDRIAAIRRAMPDCGITTDMFTGFHDETEEDFEETLSLMREVVFDSAFMFKYSERPGTFASKNLPDNVPEEVKIDRLNRMIALQNELSAESYRRDIGKTFEVLVEGTSKRSREQLFGRNEQNKVIVFPRGNHHIGDRVMVTVESASSATLIGKEA